MHSSTSAVPISVGFSKPVKPFSMKQKSFTLAPGQSREVEVFAEPLDLAS